MTESVVHWQFKSEKRAPRQVTFFGPSISVEELKKRIVSKQHLDQTGRKEGGECDVTFLGFNGNDLVPKNTLVTVIRVPKSVPRQQAVPLPKSPPPPPPQVQAIPPVHAETSPKERPILKRRRDFTPQCSLCQDQHVDAVTTPCCRSSYCDECIRQHLAETQDSLCPTCTTPIEPCELQINV